MKIKSLFSVLLTGLISLWWLMIVNAEYSQELQDAYEWAHSVSVTTKPTIDSANMMWNITRAEMAKMISNYAKNILNKTTDVSAKCEFNDTLSVKWDLATAIIDACQLWLMWQWITEFRPNDPVTRAEFWTVLSRTLWWDKNEWWSTYYQNHLKALQSKWIMNNISSPTDKEVRWYVMLMLMRASWEKAENNEQAKPEETVVPENNQNEVKKSESKTLVVYFSRADENYSVWVVEKWNTAFLAEHIANYLNADTFEILPVVAYPAKYSEATEVAKKEQNDNARPEYKWDVNSWSDYNTIFLWYPIWWWDIPMVFYTFIESHDFSWKDIYLFNTHEWSGIAWTYSSLKNKLSTANVNTDWLPMRWTDARKDSAKWEVEKWLQGLWF